MGATRPGNMHMSKISTYPMNGNADCEVMDRYVFSGHSLHIRILQSSTVVGNISYSSMPSHGCKSWLRNHPQVDEHSAQILKVTQFICGNWWNSDGYINDKWVILQNFRFPMSKINFLAESQSSLLGNAYEPVFDEVVVTLGPRKADKVRNKHTDNWRHLNSSLPSPNAYLTKSRFEWFMGQGKNRIKRLCDPGFSMPGISTYGNLTSSLYSFGNSKRPWIPRSKVWRHKHRLHLDRKGQLRHETSSQSIYFGGVKCFNIYTTLPRATPWCLHTTNRQNG